MSAEDIRPSGARPETGATASEAGRERGAAGFEVEESNEFEQIELSTARRLSDFHGLDLAGFDDDALLPEAQFFPEDLLEDSPVGVGDRLVQLERRCLELTTLVRQQAARLAAMKDEHRKLAALVRERMDAAVRERPLFEGEEVPTIAADSPPPPLSPTVPDLHAAATPDVPHCVLLPIGNDDAQVFELTGTRAYVGRGGEADLRIADTTVSRLHAVIRAGDGGLVIEDVGSRNGLFVNDFRVRRAVVSDGDRVTFGTVAYVVRVLPGTASQAHHFSQ